MTATRSPSASRRSGSNGHSGSRRPVSDQLLTFLKYIFLAVLYLFFLRVLRAVWVELREPKPAPLAPTPAPVPSPSNQSDARSAHPSPGERGPERLVVVAPADHKGSEFA